MTFFLDYGLPLLLAGIAVCILYRWRMPKEGWR